MSTRVSALRHTPRASNTSIEPQPNRVRRKPFAGYGSGLAVAVAAVLLLLWPGAAGAQVQDLIKCEQLHAFLGGAKDGEWLLDPVIEGRDGRLYGATINGGVEDGGVVFALTKDGSEFVILHDFTSSTNDGIWPWGGVIQGQDGKLYGAARYGGTQDAGVVFSLNTDGTGFTNLYSFTTRPGLLPRAVSTGRRF